MDSSDSSVDHKRRDRSASEEKHQTNKLFITNIDGKVLLPRVRPKSLKSRTNSEDSSRSTEPLKVWWPKETETQNTVSPSLT